MIYWQLQRPTNVRGRWIWPKVVKLVKTQSKKNRLGHRRFSHRTSTSERWAYKHPKEQDQVKDRFQTTNQIVVRAARRHLSLSMKRETKFSASLGCPHTSHHQSLWGKKAMRRQRHLWNSIHQKFSHQNLTIVTHSLVQLMAIMTTPLWYQRWIAQVLILYLKVQCLLY